MIRIEGLCKAFGPKVLFDGATFHFPQGERVALVGANGVGKTTLLNVLCGFEEADKGEILKPARCVLGYLPQEPNAHPEPTILRECVEGAFILRELKAKRDSALERMTAQYSEETHHAFEEAEEAFRSRGGYIVESRAREILVGLGFSTQDFVRDPRVLSGGWRMRLELARVFLNNPDFLILDEPTNHLDLPSLVWVEKYLQSFMGTVLFVSHDKDLLNRLATVVLHLHHGRLQSYKGNFDEFLDAREARAQEEAALSEQLRKRREHLEQFIERFGAKATKAKQAKSKLKMLARIQDLESEIPTDDPESSLVLSLPEPPPCGKEVLSIEKGSIGYSHPLATGINLRIIKGAKIAIIGVNGIGKSTLLKTIVGRIPALAGEFKFGHNVSVGYFSQDQLDVLNPQDTVLRNVLSVSEHLTEKNARALLGSFLFRGDDVFKPVGVLSGGEKSRVGLACLLAHRANFLVLDEPTNHLDMSSVEVLSEAIEEYEGTVLYVSHDRSFIDATCTHVFVMLPDGRSALFAGKLDDYERLAALSGFPNVLDSAAAVKEALGETGENAASGGQGSVAPAGPSADERAAGLKRDRQRLERLISRLDEEMGPLSHKLAAIEKEMLGDASTDYVRMRELHDAQQSLRAQLAEKENAWIESSEQLESIVSELRSLGRN